MQKPHPYNMGKEFRFSIARVVLGKLLIILLAGCESFGSRYFEYPRRYDLERQRVCSQVLQRKTNKFFVSETRIHALTSQGMMPPFAETDTRLEDGVYYCGPYRFRHQSCPLFQTRHLDGMFCRFRR